MLTMATLQRLWHASPPLTAAGLLMLAAAAGSLAAMAVDATTILGAPRWLKPAKFAVSTAIYAFTLAWIFTYLPDRPRLTRRVGWITAIILVMEVAIIDLQAARGTTSHYNVATALDAALFGAMGNGILIAWIAAITLTVALFRHRFADQPFGWALRLGMLLTVMGQATGGLMTTPTKPQLDAARDTRMTVAGAHTVGGPDGGPGLPLTGWSREHGDIRVPHFVGMHAVQVLPAIAWLLTPIVPVARRRGAVIAVSAGYFALFAILLIQALNGHPLVPLTLSR
jgi:hypothetical protein